jgi:hypothetical protein
MPARHENDSDCNQQLSRSPWLVAKDLRRQDEVDGSPILIPTHGIDNFKNRVGVEVEWNNNKRS